MTTVLLISRPFSSIKLSGIEIGDYNRLSDWLGVWGQAGQKTQEKHLPLEWGKGKQRDMIPKFSYLICLFYSNISLSRSQTLLYVKISYRTYVMQMTVSYFRALWFRRHGKNSEIWIFKAPQFSCKQLLDRI